MDITRPVLDASARSLGRLTSKVGEIKEKDAKRLADEYGRLVEGLREAGHHRATDEIMANPVLPDEVLQEAVPGNIRRAEHFLAFLRRFVEYLKTRLAVHSVISETPSSFLTAVKEATQIDRKPLRYARRVPSALCSLASAIGSRMSAFPR